MSVNRKLKVAVIGAGRIGQLHAEHLAYRLPNAEVIGIADVNLDAANWCAGRFSIPRAVKDYKVLLRSHAEAVVICSSTDTHARIIEEAAQAGKHIFCEKPIDHDLAKIDRAIAAVKKAGVKLQIGFNRRFDPNFKHIRETVASGNIGDVRVVRITSRDPGPPPIEYIKVSGGMFLDMTIHDFDMARYVAASEVTQVHAVGRVCVDKKIGEAGDIDTAIITLEFANGALATIDNCREAVYGYDQRLEVFGSAGVVSADNNTPHRTVLGNKDGMHAPLPLNFFMDRYTESYLQEMREFITAIIHDTETPVTGKDGRAPVVIGLAAKRSLEIGRPVKVSEVDQLVDKLPVGKDSNTRMPDARVFHQNHSRITDPSRTLHG